MQGKAGAGLGLSFLHAVQNKGTLAMRITAEEAFEAVGAELEACETDESELPARDRALSVGFVEREKPKPQVLSYYIYTDDAGSTVTLSQRWYDPSGPCQNLPDIHKVELTLNVVGRSPVTHTAKWEA